MESLSNKSLTELKSILVSLFNFSRLLSMELLLFDSTLFSSEVKFFLFLRKNLFNAKSFFNDNEGLLNTNLFFFLYSRIFA